MSPSLAALRLQCTPRQTFQTGYGGRIRTYVNEFQKLAPFQLGHSVRIFELVDLARFERATSTFAESRSHSAELQVRIGMGILARSQRPIFPGTEPTRCKVYDSDSGNAEMERFERSQEFSRHLSGVLPCQLGDISKMAEGYGVEPYAVINRRSFQDCLTHSTVGPSSKFGRDARI